MVSLKRRACAAPGFRQTNAPLVVGDVVVVAGNGSDGGDLFEEESAPEDARPDRRNRQLLWTLRV
jgi:hypothetical protein